MTLLVALSVGVLFAAGAYMLMRRSFVKIVIGLALLGHAANLLIYVSAGLVKGRPPLVDPTATVPALPHADPLPAALILTAIVISFAVMSFTIVLIKRAYQDIGTDDLDRMQSTEM